MSPREREYTVLVQELQNRYRDIPAGARWAYLMTAGLAIADADSIKDRGKLISEDEFITLSKSLFQRMRRLG